MGHSLRKFTLLCASSTLLLIPAANIWAVPLVGAAHLSAQSTQAMLPRTVRFREEQGRGLLLSAWVNGAGPYTFAIDTGAGATLLSRRVAIEARVALSSRRPLMIGGLSGAGSVAGYEASVRSLALGDSQNLLPTRGFVLVTERLAPGIDGVLDPAEAYGSLGFEIDMVRGELTAFDPRLQPLRKERLSRGSRTGRVAAPLSCSKAEDAPCSIQAQVLDWP
jgi:hypothetical protein